MKIARFVLPFLLLTLLIVVGGEALAQCPMCRSAVETAMQNEGNQTGAGLNDGIIYLLSMPYLAVLITGGIWYYHRKKSRK